MIMVTPTLTPGEVERLVKRLRGDAARAYHSEPFSEYIFLANMADRLEAAALRS